MYTVMAIARIECYVKLVPISLSDFFQHVCSVPRLEADTYSADLPWRKRENLNHMCHYTCVNGWNTEHTTGEAPCKFATSLIGLSFPCVIENQRQPIRSCVTLLNLCYKALWREIQDFRLFSSFSVPSILIRLSFYLPLVCKSCQNNKK